MLRQTRAELARSVRAESVRDDFSGCALAVNERLSLSSVIIRPETTVLIIIVVAPCYLHMNGLARNYVGRSRVTARVGAGGTRALGPEDRWRGAGGGGRGAMAGRR